MSYGKLATVTIAGCTGIPISTTIPTITSTACKGFSAINELRIMPCSVVKNVHCNVYLHGHPYKRFESPFRLGVIQDLALPAGFYKLHSSLLISFADAALVHANRLPMYISPAPAPKPHQACPLESKIGRWFEAHKLWQFLSFEMFKCISDGIVTQPNRVSSSSAWLVVIIFSTP